MSRDQTQSDIMQSDVESSEEETVESSTDRVAILEAENRRLRQLYAASRRQSYHRTAAGLAAIGLVALAGAVIFPSSSTVLLALAGTGLFAALLTYYLTPERFLARFVGDRIQEAAAENIAALTAELELSERRVFIPVEGPEPARLYVPQHANGELPPEQELTGLFVTESDRYRGVALLPSGATLFPEFRETLSGEVATEPQQLTAQVTECLVDDFELVTSVDVEIGDDEEEVILEFADSTFDPAREDCPPASFAAVVLAAGLDEPLQMETEALDDETLVAKYAPVGVD